MADKIQIQYDPAIILSHYRAIISGLHEYIRGYQSLIMQVDDIYEDFFNDYEYEDISLNSVSAYRSAYLKEPKLRGFFYHHQNNEEFDFVFEMTPELKNCLYKAIDLEKTRFQAETVRLKKQKEENEKKKKEIKAKKFL